MILFFVLLLAVLYTIQRDDSNKKKREYLMNIHKSAELENLDIIQKR